MKTGAASKASLSPAWQKLIKLMTRVRYGGIEYLTVRGGEPCFDPPPRIVRELRMKPTKAARAEIADYELKDQILELVRHFREIDHGIVQRLEIQDGLPFRLVLEGLDETHPNTQPKTEARS